MTTLLLLFGLTLFSSADLIADGKEHEHLALTMSKH